MYVFPDPRASVKSLLEGGRSSYWPGATVATSFPSRKAADELSGAAWPLTSAGWIQHAWDGTSSQQANRQVCTIRVTVWMPKDKPSNAIATAQKVLAYLLANASATVWRFTPGAGPLPGVDDDTELSFCTFTVNAETRASAVV